MAIEEGFETFETFEAPAAPVPPHVPADAALWLSAEQQEEWIALKKQAPMLMFGSFVAFNLISALSLRIINRKNIVTVRSNKVLLQYGTAAATHAILCLALSFYTVVHTNLASLCGSRIFCLDDMSARMLTVHAGYALFEFLFWQNNSGVARPWTEMLLLHNVITVLQAFAYLVYPSRLTLLVLPVQQMLEVATLVDCARRFCAVYGAPWHLRFKLQLGFLVGNGARALVSSGLAAFVFYWIRRNNLWKLDLPEGASALNSTYGLILLAGCVIQALIYVKWVGASLEMTNSLITAMQSGGKGGKGAAEKTKAAVKQLSAGGRKKEKGRR